MPRRPGIILPQYGAGGRRQHDFATLITSAWKNVIAGYTDYISRNGGSTSGSSGRSKHHGVDHRNIVFSRKRGPDGFRQ